ncbi:MAG: hypothetical protein JXR96_09910 [Deltaproteobacteria bacterium]|nr:hypothetical protein [Deltaproteobacteria bacterium]
MSPGADQHFEQALADLVSGMREIGAPFMLIGGLAVISRGVPRTTHDIDATCWAEGLDPERVLDVLGRHGIEPRIGDAAEFARQRQVFLLRHRRSGTPLELSLAWLPFEREALEHATDVPIGDVVAPVARAEDLVVFKAVAWRDRDRDDIARLLVLHAETIDLDRVRRLVSEFAAVLEQPERLDEFDTLVARTAGRDS